MCLVDQMAHANVNLNFNAFLEKTKLKDDGSNYTDWDPEPEDHPHSSQESICPRRTAR